MVRIELSDDNYCVIKVWVIGILYVNSSPCVFLQGQGEDTVIYLYQHVLSNHYFQFSIECSQLLSYQLQFLIVYSQPSLYQFQCSENLFAVVTYLIFIINSHLTSRVVSCPISSFCLSLLVLSFALSFFNKLFFFFISSRAVVSKLVIYSVYNNINDWCSMYNVISCV